MRGKLSYINNLIRKNIGTWEYTRRTNILIYRRTQLLLWGGVMYLST